MLATAYSVWERGVKNHLKKKRKQLEQILNAPKRLFLQSLKSSDYIIVYQMKGRDQALVMLGKLVQQEQCKNVVSDVRKTTNTIFFRKMSAGIGSSVYNDQTMIQSIMMKN